MAGFAGTRSTDERRRRRLATDGDEKAKIDTPRPASPTGADRHPSDIPLRKVISARLWKIWAASFLVLTAGVAVVAGGWAAANRPDLLGPGLTALFDLESGRAARTFNGLMFLAFGQLSLLICWTRAQSLKDFDARYRAWAWVGAAGLLAGATVLSGAHVALADTLFWKWNAPIPHRALLAWLVPAAIVGLVCLRLMHLEMRNCRSGLVMLYLGAAAFAAFAALQFNLVTIPVAGVEPLVNAGVAAFGQVSLFAGLVLHARYVIYQSTEPPKPRKKPETPAEIKAKVAAPAAAAKAPAAETTKPRAAKPTPAAEAKPAPQKAQPKRVEADEYDDDEFDDDDDQQRGSKKHRLHSAHERHEMLKGLSKRERRQMRKSWRDQERAMAGNEE